MNNNALKTVADFPDHPFHIVEQNRVAAFFQPIISVAKMSVVGLEALNRSVGAEDGGFIEPEDLFEGLEEEKSLRLELDRLFRDKGLESFTPFQDRLPELLLFLNIDSSILMPDVVGSGYLLNQVRKLGLDPQQIVVQITRSEDMNVESVIKFIEMQRANNFLIALDEVGYGPSDLEWVLKANPDVVKLRNSRVMGIAHDKSKRDGFRALAKLAHSLAIPILADGIGNEEDALVALGLGADLLQGSYFSRMQNNNFVLTLGRKSRMIFLAQRYRNQLQGRARRDRDRSNRCANAAKAVFSALEEMSIRDYQQQFGHFFRSYPQLECLYLLDAKGIQVTDTACNELHIPERKRFLFQPASKGTDHSLKEHFYIPMLKTGRFHLSEPRLSSNSGSLCVTASQPVTDPATGGEFILCADVEFARS